MNGPAARGFAPVLREVERGLALPIPDRVRILRELEYDLEELCARLVAGGLSDEVARGRAVQALVPEGPPSMNWGGCTHPGIGESPAI